MLTRVPWSKMRAWSLAGSIATVIVAAGSIISSVVYTGQPETGDLFWLCIACAMVTTTAYAAACVRDVLLARQDSNAKLIATRLQNLELLVCDYGDHREARGHNLANRVANVQRNGRLAPVD